MSAKAIARMMVLTVALAGAIGALSGKVPLIAAALFVVLANGGAVAWLKWHEEQQPADHR